MNAHMTVLLDSLFASNEIEKQKQRGMRLMGVENNIGVQKHIGYCLTFPQSMT
jgi:hypothetical protein